MEGEHINQSDQHANGLQLDERPKPTCINEQHNHNCQQFYGNLNNCTIVCSSVSPSGVNAQKKKKQQKKGSVATSDMPKTIKYFKHGNDHLLREQRSRVDILYKKWTEWKWIDPNTSPDDLDAFFEGAPRHCNITWIASTTILTILLQELLEQSYVEKQTGCFATSLAKTQFGKTPNSDRTRLDETSKDRIKLSLIILDINNPLPTRNDRNTDNEDVSDAALCEVYFGNMRSTKGV